MKQYRSRLVLITIAFLCFGVSQAQAQIQNPVNTRIQLPVLRFFNIRTAVMVPDGGRLGLGGVSRHSEGSISRGVPLLGGRPFTNRGAGFESSGNHANVKVTILSTQEMSDDVLAAARAAKAKKTNPNGSAEVRRKADFLTRNIGRKKRR